MAPLILAKNLRRYGNHIQSSKSIHCTRFALRSTAKRQSLGATYGRKVSGIPPPNPFLSSSLISYTLFSSFFVLFSFPFVPHIDDKYENDDDDDDEENDNKENTTTNGKRGAKKPRLSTSDSTIESTPFLVKHQWMPNYNIAVWENHLFRKFVTVIVVLDGGVNIEKDVNLKVSDDGHELIIKQKMVDRLTDIDKLHNFLRKKDPSAYPCYHPKIMALQKSLKLLHMEVGGHIYNTARIKLPLQVQSDTEEKHKLGYNEGVRLLYVDLKAVQCENSIAVVDDPLIMCE
jgi:hypothetical protein